MPKEIATRPSGNGVRERPRAATVRSAGAGLDLLGAGPAVRRAVAPPPEADRRARRRGLVPASGRRSCEAGQPGGTFYVIVEGEAKVLRGNRTSRRLGPGDFFGEISLLDGGPRTATVVAATPVRRDPGLQAGVRPARRQGARPSPRRSSRSSPAGCERPSGRSPPDARDRLQLVEVPARRGVLAFVLFHGVSMVVALRLRRERDRARIAELLQFSGSSSWGCTSRSRWLTCSAWSPGSQGQYWNDRVVLDLDRACSCSSIGGDGGRRPPLLPAAEGGDRAPAVGRSPPERRGARGSILRSPVALWNAAFGLRRARVRSPG